jgi:hypothetical protein
MRAQRWRIVGSFLPLACTILAFDTITPTSATSGAAEHHRPFSLGILRRDGILMPFAVYDGKQWKNPWPAPNQTSTMPIAVADIPKDWWYDKHPITNWALFPLDRDQSAHSTASTRTVHVKGINWFVTNCQRSVGLRTDYQPAILPPPPRMHPYPKDALAFAGDVTISPIEIVAPTDPVAVSLAKQLPDAITPKEDAQVERYTRGNWRHSYNPSERKRVHVDLEAVYRVRKALEGHDVYYFEAIKRYFLPKSPVSAEKSRESEEKNPVSPEKSPVSPEKSAATKRPQTCDLVTFASGWFTTNAGDAIGELTPHLVVTSCDFQHVDFMLPLGTVTVDGQTPWIVQWSNPTFESYAIMQPTESLLKAKDSRDTRDNQSNRAVEIPLESSGGNCAREED